MKKSGLRDMKQRNRQLVMRAVLEQGALSRIEIAKRTELSPSTVSSLVSELLTEGYLTESGVRVATAGRSRTELTVNGDRGWIAVAEIGRKSVALQLFDLALNPKGTVPVADHYLAGNELLAALTAALFDQVGHEALRQGMLLGIGLLFQKDMRASDFNVMYSTGFSSASISLNEALFTQFRVPVVEEYSQVYTAAHAMGAIRSEAAGSAHIAIGASVVASVTLNGRPVPLKNGMCADMTPLLSPEAVPLLPGAGGETTGTELSAQPARCLAFLAQQIGALAALLCTLFPLDVVFLSGAPAQAEDFRTAVEACLTARLQPGRVPRVEPLPADGAGNMAQLLADRVRRNVLCAG